MCLIIRNLESRTWSPPNESYKKIIIRVPYWQLVLISFVLIWILIHYFFFITLRLLQTNILLVLPYKKDGQFAIVKYILKISIVERNWDELTTCHHLIQHIFLMLCMVFFPSLVLSSHMWHAWPYNFCCTHWCFFYERYNDTPMTCIIMSNC